jgi:hypothetical protein
MKSYYVLPALALADGHLASEISHKINLMVKLFLLKI